MEDDRETARGDRAHRIAAFRASVSPVRAHESGDAERAAGASLAFEAVAHRDLARLALAFEHEARHSDSGPSESPFLYPLARGRA